MPAVRAPAIAFAPELLLAARGLGEGIGAAIFDVDGVLTDGRLYIGESGETMKAFSTLDGQGIKLLAQGGIVPIVVSGRDSPAVRRRMAELGVVHAAYGAADKMAAAAALVDALSLGWERVAAIGDDWPDLPLMRAPHSPRAPPGAHVEVRAAAHHVTAAPAGYGAAREFCDLLLVAAGATRAAARSLALARWHSLTTRSWLRASRTTTRSTCPSPVPSRWCRPRPGTCACSISLRPTCRWR
jgi:3-deoxy-D-manno-octulosonate 8-phosphate phosphatase (KDO 8-P phosphatase)